jgi:hypothetical protein
MSQGLTLAAPPRETHVPRSPDTSVTIGYFQRTLPVALILSAFLVFTLPLSALAVWYPDSPQFLRLEILYLIGLGVTHFVITPTIYFQSSNLRYFNSTWRNRLIYFAIPVGIFLLFDLYRALQLSALVPFLDIALRLTIRSLDFQHFGRQSYGVLQLFKARAGCQFPAWQRRAEYWFSWTVAALLLTTFLRGGRIDALDSHPALVAASIGLAAVLTGLFVSVLTGITLTARKAEHPSRLLAPAAYFLLQAGSALLAAYSTALYGFALAMHFVEYHVLMMPRCCNAPLDTRRTIDRLFGVVRTNRVVFYCLIVLAAFGISLLTGLGTSMVQAMAALAATMWSSLGVEWAPASSYTLLLAIFDGIFVFHYFVEMFIWRFSEPHYRQTLGPLYFAPKK